ncbi:MAG: formate/nitrite transporter family protein [Firmicutes bacterium]|nr:formate/nitrite transporter family protein [Bacillota bacterium]
MSGFKAPAEIARAAVEAGAAKARLSTGQLLVLGFLAGAFIALGGLLDVRVTAGLPRQIWGSFASFLGAAVFPVGLVLVVVAGAELLTGNMAVLPIAAHAGRTGWGGVMRNWFWALVGNFLGSLFVAYVFGVTAGLLTAEPYRSAVVALGVAKVKLGFLATVASGIGCNWLVALAVWLALGSEDVVSKILGIWFPIMAFVGIGFQHVVANMFFVPAALFVGAPFGWAQAFRELAAAFLGNLVGAWLFVAAAYWYVYLRQPAARREAAGVELAPATPAARE